MSELPDGAKPRTHIAQLYRTAHTSGVSQGLGPRDCKIFKTEMSLLYSAFL